MKIDIRVLPRSSRNLVKEESGILKVRLTKPAQKNLANEQLLEVLSDYFGVKKYQIRILRGENSRKKTVEIATQDVPPRNR